MLLLVTPLAYIQGSCLKRKTESFLVSTLLAYTDASSTPAFYFQLPCLCFAQLGSQRGSPQHCNCRAGSTFGA